MKYFALILFLIGFNIVYAQVNSTVAIEGLYTGRIVTPKNIEVDLEVNLFFGKEFYPTSDHNDFWNRKTQIQSALLLEKEAGPYQFRNVLFDPLTGKIQFFYHRPSNPGPVSNFRLEGYFVSPEKIEGRAFSSTRGELGAFELTRQTSEFTTLKAQNILIGDFRGIWTFPEEYSEDLTIHLSPSPEDSLNPQYYEFETTNGKTGSYRIDRLTFAFKSIHFDYFTRQFQFIAQGSEDRKITLIGTFDQDQLILEGQGSSSLRGNTGHFKVQKGL